MAPARIAGVVEPESAFGAALPRVPQAMARALELDSDLERLVAPLNGTRAIVLGRGFTFSTAEGLALKFMETGYVMAGAWSVADFHHGPIVVFWARTPAPTVT